MGTPNGSEGSDHGWGGNYFLQGGRIKGGKILGRYPDNLDGELNVDPPTGRGRFIPTTCWEAIWNGISEWMGVENKAALDRILPNRHNCGGRELFTQKELFSNVARKSEMLNVG